LSQHNPLRGGTNETKTACYVLPPEIVPRLASRGIIEGEAASIHVFPSIVENRRGCSDACVGRVLAAVPGGTTPHRVP